jgi:hypothetical protein
MVHLLQTDRQRRISQPVVSVGRHCPWKSIVLLLDLFEQLNGVCESCTLKAVVAEKVLVRTCTELDAETRFIILTRAPRLVCSRAGGHVHPNVSDAAHGD